MRLTIEIDASPEDVFDLYTDPDRRSEWNPAARSVTIEAGAVNEPGSRYVVESRYGKLHVEVLEVDRPRRYRLRERSGMMESEAELRLEPLPVGRCRVTVDATLERHGLAVRLLAPLMEPAFRWWARGELRRLKRVAEGDRARR